MIHRLPAPMAPRVLRMCLDGCEIGGSFLRRTISQQGEETKPLKA